MRTKLPVRTRFATHFAVSSHARMAATLRGRRAPPPAARAHQLHPLAADGAVGSGSSSTGGGVCRFPTDRVVGVARGGRAGHPPDRGQDRHGQQPGGHYWGPGNMLGAIDLETGQITVPPFLSGSGGCGW